MSTQRVDTITNLAGTGAPNFPFGFTSSASTQNKVVTSADYTVLDSDGYSIIAVSTGSSDRTVTLPLLANNIGRVLTIVKSDSGTGVCYIDGNGSETINGSSSATFWGSFIQYDNITVQAQSGGWIVVGATDTQPSFSANTSNTAASSSTPVVFSNTLYDSHTAYNGTTGRYTIPRNGTYVVVSQIFGTTPNFTAHLYLNGTDTLQGHPNSNTGQTASGASIMRRFVKGDIIDIRPDNSVTMNNSASLNSFSITRLSA